MTTPADVTTPADAATSAGSGAGRALVWLRRDLRVDDNAALHRALVAAREVWCVFLFDRDILDDLPAADRRVEFIHESVAELDRDLAALAAEHGRAGVRLIVGHGRPVAAIPELAAALGVEAVFANHDDDPAALARDAAVAAALGGTRLLTSKDHVVFERSEVLTATRTPYSVFTPYKNAWLKKLAPADLRAHAVRPHAGVLAPLPDRLPAAFAAGVPPLESLGFERTNLGELGIATGSSGGQHLLADFLDRIDDYEDARNFPAVKGPSYLSVHLRFGTVSIRELARVSWERTLAPGPAGARGAQVWLSELIWRDFYHQVLHHHPRVVGASFKPEYDAVAWESGPVARELFAAWCEGRTGYPLVDAAMAQINQTGYMHNRLRMVVASFLTKDLGIDWRWGEAYFARQLNDFDLAANNGGWQWAASTGCDAQPYFRIFNPVSQSEKFDPGGRFIRRYLPQLAALPDRAIHAPWDAAPLDLALADVELGRDYPLPVVRHDEARARTLARYSVVKAAR
ncbi:cryptochrome/photolyase family protein [Pengzhenrongella sicca]|uniref:Deoxyribodipyrimidine photo-lyase n=1 Tax=Pengzhenrongella sicca TaxID=2819238 RepID=A0A8A4ZFG9_9MICO|nr:deoxyribodipyrimidine photo-lyase [Pengzhenrongella sicca]QTE29286.1 deoxyribodipyrimidine photo-lyase [Pengzhenrongella sicca]